MISSKRGKELANQYIGLSGKDNSYIQQNQVRKVQFQAVGQGSVSMNASHLQNINLPCLWGDFILIISKICIFMWLKFLQNWSYK